MNAMMAALINTEYFNVAINIGNTVKTMMSYLNNGGVVTK